MAYKIRTIKQSDAQGYREALNAVISERRYLLTVQTPSLKETEDFIHNNLSNNHAQYVALIDSTIVAWADIIPHQKELMKHGGLLGMGVISEHRGKGIGKELLLRTVDHARKTGLKRIELEVFANNSVAIALYKRCGFEHEGTKRNARYINDNYEDVCIMSQCYV